MIHVSTEERGVPMIQHSDVVDVLHKGKHYLVFISLEADEPGYYGTCQGCPFNDIEPTVCHLQDTGIFGSGKEGEQYAYHSVRALEEDLS